MTLPKQIIKKLHAYHKHTVRAEELRVEIEQWFISKGVEQATEDGDLSVTDTLIDGSMQGFDDHAIEALWQMIQKEITITDK